MNLYRTLHSFSLIYQHLMHNLGHRSTEDGEDHHHRFSSP